GRRRGGGGLDRVPSAPRRASHSAARSRRRAAPLRARTLRVRRRRLAAHAALALARVRAGDDPALLRPGPAARRPLRRPHGRGAHRNVTAARDLCDVRTHVLAVRVHERARARALRARARPADARNARGGDGGRADSQPRPPIRRLRLRRRTGGRGVALAPALPPARAARTPPRVPVPETSPTLRPAGGDVRAPSGPPPAPPPR